MTEPAKGVFAMIAACTVWGLSPLYYAMLKHVPSLEVLCYRAVWSLVFFVFILVVQRRLKLVWQALRVRDQFVWIVIAACMISANWFGFIYAISVGQGMDASMGYYIFPLVAVLIGRLAYGDRLQTLQWGAVGLATVAVLVLTIGLGVTPYLALWLAITFAIYGVAKRRLPLGPVVSVTAEVCVLLPLAVGWLLFAGTQAGAPIGDHTLLALSGPLTATPLILFSYAARRVRMSSIGLTQYLNPTLQFGCAVFVFSEPFTDWHKFAFALIWAALILFSISQFRQERASRKAASSAGTVSTVST